MNSIIQKWMQTNLIFGILIGIITGALLGSLCPQAAPVSYPGTLFISTLKAIVPILVFVLVPRIKGRKGHRLIIPGG